MTSQVVEPSRVISWISRQVSSVVGEVIGFLLPWRRVRRGGDY